VPDGARLRVAIDATSLLGEPTGVGQVSARLIEALAGRDDLELTAFAITWRGRHDLDARVPPNAQRATRRFPARLTRALWPRFDAPKVEHWTGACDIVHATSFVAPPSDAPVLLTVHDLTFVRFPEMCSGDTLSYPTLIGKAIERGAVVHTYSDYIADEIREYFRLPEERVVRVYPGLAATSGGDAAAGRRLAGTDRYILALGTIEPRKNLPTLARAFDAVAADDDDVRLVIGGPDGWGVEAFEAACAEVMHADRITRLGYVNDRQRRDLLAGATVLAYPSIYEGFGHPPLEAMLAGVPVVASNAGALIEVLGPAALLPDPDDAEAIGAALTRVVADADLRAELIARGHDRTRRYSWEQASRDFSALYREVVDRSRA
jgi:glycosyltransferase involved in cell wall biosynthesis